MFCCFWPYNSYENAWSSRWPLGPFFHWGMYCFLFLQRPNSPFWGCCPGRALESGEAVGKFGRTDVLLGCSPAAGTGQGGAPYGPMIPSHRMWDWNHQEGGASTVEPWDQQPGAPLALISQIDIGTLLKEVPCVNPMHEIWILFFISPAGQQNLDPFCQDRCVELTEKLELLQPDLQKKDLSGCFEAACEEFGGDFFHFYPFLGWSDSFRWFLSSWRCSHLPMVKADLPIQTPFNPVIRGCILLQLAFFQETLRQTNLRIEGEIEDLERERR